tara:strand:- start:313 stop:666 length:354 start_codon:yes stop_codon:yes gene_type:complete
MKILIWVHKNDVMANKILTYHFTRPVIDRHDDYVQVILTHDEFVSLVDNKKLSNTVDEFWKEDINPFEGSPLLEDDIDKETDREAAWLISQYNRNRDAKDHITDVDDIDQNNQPFGD